ncbi:MAG TPA: hypothetical protein VIQ99_01590 [Gammaproteobacteria bacterium]
MFDRITVVRTALLALSLGTGATALAQTADRGCIELKTVAEVEETYVDANGNTATRLTPAAKVVPGDEVVWTIVANNVCTSPAGDVAITNPVPDHMRYVGNSAFGPGANIEFSLDGTAFAAAEALTVAEADGSRRAARADEYSAIRWALPRPMGPSESLVVRYRAVVL